LPADVIMNYQAKLAEILKLALLSKLLHLFEPNLHSASTSGGDWQVLFMGESQNAYKQEAQLPQRYHETRYPS